MRSANLDRLNTLFLLIITLGEGLLPGMRFLQISVIPTVPVKIDQKVTHRCIIVVHLLYLFSKVIQTPHLNLKVSLCKIYKVPCMMVIYNYYVLWMTLWAFKCYCRHITRSDEALCFCHSNIISRH